MVPVHHYLPSPLAPLLAQDLRTAHSTDVFSTCSLVTTGMLFQHATGYDVGNGGFRFHVSSSSPFFLPLLLDFGALSSAGRKEQEMNP